MIKDSIVKEIAALFADVSSIQLSKMLADAKHNYEQLKIAFDARADAEQPVAKYKYTIIQGANDGIKGIRILGKVTNSAEKDAHIALYGAIGGGWEDRRSVFYYRINGLICHTGGGWIILADKATEHQAYASSEIPIPCTDEQWEQLLNGTIPEELMNTRI